MKKLTSTEAIVIFVCILAFSGALIFALIQYTKRNLLIEVRQSIGQTISSEKLSELSKDNCFKERAMLHLEKKPITIGLSNDIIEDCKLDKIRQHQISVIQK